MYATLYVSASWHIITDTDTDTNSDSVEIFDSYVVLGSCINIRGLYTNMPKVYTIKKYSEF